jgi:hypothetical protein
MSLRYPIRIPESLADAGPHVLESPAVRFTLDGSADLENHLDRTCQKVLSSLLDLIPAKKLEAILLGGGYGRGEGGVLRTTAGDRPYNDLEFYVFLRGNRLLNQQTYEPVLHQAARELSSVAGLTVEFKVASLSALRHQAVDMFTYDLVTRHRWLWGGENLLQGCEHHREETHLPLSEATRLLLNRCTGLLLAREMVEHDLFAVENADFIARNLAKLQLALGDAVLTAYGRYHWSCRERAQRLAQFSANKDLPWLAEVQRHHVEGVHFKLHPQRHLGNSEQLQAAHAELSGLSLRLWLWLESRRLNHTFISARDYGLSGLDKCPETRPWRNYLVNVWQFGTEMMWSGKALRHPRERLMRALALLLWEPATVHEPQLLHRVQRDVQTYATSFTGLVTAYQKMWRRFN